MKKSILYILLLMLSSCGVLEKKSVSTPFAVDDVRLNIGLDDLVCMGQVETSVTYRTYLGFIKVIDSVNGVAYNRYNVKKARLDAHSGLLTGPVRKATYKAVEAFPDADYYRPVYKTTERNRLFLGSEVSTQVVIRAYKYKIKKK